MSFEHPWNLTPQQAIALQEELCGRLVNVDQFGPIRTVAGVDVGIDKDGDRMRAAVAVLDFPSLKLRDWAIAYARTNFPYIPGLLSFRELPAVLKALAGIRIRPDLLLCDGQGYSHPRRFGIACHLGLLADIPAIGVAKSRLIGEYEGPGNARGSWEYLYHDREIIGAVLRTRAAVKPVYVSIGHRVSLESAIRFVLECSPRFRLPETTRWAHRLASGKWRS